MMNDCGDLIDNGEKEILWTKTTPPRISVAEDTESKSQAVADFLSKTENISRVENINGETKSITNSSISSISADDTRLHNYSKDQQDKRFYNMPDKTVLKDSKLRRINPKYHQRFEELFQMTNSDLKLKFRRFNYLIAVIDLLCILLDFYIIGGLYLQHFEFLHNRYIFTDDITKWRFVFIFLSVLVSVLLIIGSHYEIKRENIKYVLNVVNITTSQKFFDKFFFFQIIVHIIQPYPLFHLEWKIRILGNEITYTLDMILFVIALLRFVTYIKFVNYWFLFASDRSKRVYNFFQGNFTKNRPGAFGFFVKATKYYYSLLCLFPIFFGLVYFYALVFKIFEDIDPDGKNTGFNYIVNCIWFIMVTMTTIGYGDFFPITMIGRMITVTCCIFGVFMISLIFSSFFYLVEPEEGEKIAQDEIEHFERTRNKDDNKYDNYVRQYLLYKMDKVRNFKKNVLDTIVKKFKLGVLREEVLHQIKRKVHVHNRPIRTFVHNIDTIWNQVDDNLIALHTIKNRIEPKLELLKPDGPYSYFDEVKASQKMGFQIFNMAKYYKTCGGLFELSDLKNIQTKSLLSSERLNPNVLTFTKIHKKNNINYEKKNKSTFVKSKISSSDSEDEHEGLPDRSENETFSPLNSPKRYNKSNTQIQSPPSESDDSPKRLLRRIQTSGFKAMSLKDIDEKEEDKSA